MTVLLDIDHEAGDLSEWDTNTFGSDAWASTDSGLGGTVYGAHFQVTAGNKYLGAEPSITSDVAQLRWRFYVDLSDFTVPVSPINLFRITNLRLSATPWRFCDMEIQSDSNKWDLKVQRFDDRASTNMLIRFCASDESPGEYWIEAHSVRSTTATSSDGTFQLWINDSDEGTKTGLDNFSNIEIVAQFRAETDNMDVGSDVIKVDEIIMNDTGDYIGPVAAPAVDEQTAVMARHLATLRGE